MLTHKSLGCEAISVTARGCVGCRESFLSFYVTSTLSDLVPFLLMMSQVVHNFKGLTSLFDNKYCAILAEEFEHDLLHHRGIMCCTAFLKKSAKQVALVQYMIFILVLNYTSLNVEVFPIFSKEANFNFEHQALFVAIAWGFDFVVYELTNVVCKQMFDITPLYVGTALLEEYPRLRLSFLIIAAHIISDVYLSMVFAMEGGFYFKHNTSVVS